MSTVEVAAVIGGMIAGVAAQRGVDGRWLCAEAGFDPASAADPDARILIGVETRLWDLAAAACGDPHFGLHTAEAVRPGAFDVLDYAVRTAPTLRAALERLARYNRLVHDAAVFSLAEGRERLRVEHSLGGTAQSPHAAEFTLAAIVVVGAQLAQSPVRALAVEFRHAAPGGASLVEYERVIGCAPRFGAPVNAIELPRATVDAGVPAFDPALSRVIERNAEALLAALPEPSEPLVQRLRRLLTTTLAQDASRATLAALAAELKLSERSLQRRLADEGTSFEDVLDELRRELALRYLADRKLSIAEAAYLLGYSEASAFHRAFKRWTGFTPSQARARAA